MSVLADMVANYERMYGTTPAAAETMRALIRIFELVAPTTRLALGHVDGGGLQLEAPGGAWEIEVLPDGLVAVLCEDAS